MSEAQREVITKGHLSQMFRDNFNKIGKDNSLCSSLLCLTIPSCTCTMIERSLSFGSYWTKQPIKGSENVKKPSSNWCFIETLSGDLLLCLSLSSTILIVSLELSKHLRNCQHIYNRAASISSIIRKYKFW